MEILSWMVNSYTSPPTHQLNLFHESIQQVGSGILFVCVSWINNALVGAFA